MEDVRPTKADAAFLQNACVVLASTQGFTLSWSASPLWGGVGKSLRHESIVVRCRCGLQGGTPWVRGPPARSSGVRWQACSLVVAQATGLERSPSQGLLPVGSLEALQWRESLPADYAVLFFPYYDE